ncbi:SusE outer membrane protein [Lutibacter oricola]|uniref:SusE outer membrane protein n=1 Tax=Lutibacter oricola TaxID=762486 RepID=A0A1H3GHU5_9FLAO|nr:SusE domain-containing protein [Lutibacter oricola]SDY02883.1 SusE outer membrane protein [Lutibacter oricola]
MKKLINKTVILLSFLLVLGACDDKEIIELNPDANTEVSLSTSAVLLTEDTATDEILTVSWTDPNFGFDAAASYQILMDFAGGDFSAPQISAVGSSLSKVFTVEELNGKLLSLGIKPTEETDVELIVQTTLSDAQVMLSEPITLTVTAYSSLLDLSTAWGVVGSATPGAWGNENIPDIPFYTTSTPNVFVAYANLRDGEIKFRKDNLWTENYGDTGMDGTLDNAGDNITVSAGSYKITINLDALTWEMEEYTWGLVGSATPNGWDGPDFKLEYNSYQDNWVGMVTLTDGEFKFRFNNDWGLNYGDTGFDGSLETGGDNIAVSAGHYLVTFDLNNLTYTFEETDVWGLVGDATPNAWDGPDTKFIPDFGINEGYYYINGIELTDGEIKVRQNDAWGLNYGDDGNDGSLEANGANIPVTAGTYNIEVNFSVTPPTIAVYAW